MRSNVVSLVFGGDTDRLEAFCEAVRTVLPAIDQCGAPRQRGERRAVEGRRAV